MNLEQLGGFNDWILCRWLSIPHVRCTVERQIHANQCDCSKTIQENKTFVNILIQKECKIHMSPLSRGRISSPEFDM